MSISLIALLPVRNLRGARGGGLRSCRGSRSSSQAAAVPLALQGLYVLALRGASGLGEGNQTSLTYAYLFAATLVAATASSLSMISSAPLTRRGIDLDARGRACCARRVAVARADRCGVRRVRARRRDA